MDFNEENIEKLHGVFEQNLHDRNSEFEGMSLLEACQKAIEWLEDNN